METVFICLSSGTGEITWEENENGMVLPFYNVFWSSQLVLKKITFMTFRLKFSYTLDLRPSMMGSLPSWTTAELKHLATGR